VAVVWRVAHTEVHARAVRITDGAMVSADWRCGGCASGSASSGSSRSPPTKRPPRAHASDVETEPRNPRRPTCFSSKPVSMNSSSGLTITVRIRRWR
jgi:hypothetical protein